MAILRPLRHGSMVGPVFCDFLTISTPKGHEMDLRGAIEPVIESLGPFEQTDGDYRLYEVREGMLQAAGLFKLYRRGKVCLCAAGGQALAKLREAGKLGDYLAALGSVPHRVTMLHATADYEAHASEVVRSVYEAAKAGEVSLTRKRIMPGHCSALLSPNDRGEDTGTVYLGKKGNADVWAKVYDKRWERVSKGFADPGPVVRVEVAVQSDIGATLRDALHPASIFWQFAGRSLVEAPPEFVGWEAHGEGFAIDPSPQRTLFERMQTIVDNSADLTRLCRMAWAEYGDEDRVWRTISMLLRAKVAACGVAIT